MIRRLCPCSARRHRPSEFRGTQAVTGRRGAGGRLLRLRPKFRKGLRELLKEKGSIAELASAIDKSIPDARTKLREFLTNSLLKNSAREMSELETLSRSSPNLAKEILDGFSDQALAELFGKAESQDAGDAFK
jgi:hypothetical protein